MKVKIEAEVEIESEMLEELKSIEHHAEYLFDLANWPEIKSISNVRVTGETV